jgi:molybdopterin-binding protein
MHHGSQNMKYGARNKLEGKVVDIKKGTLMCQVTVGLPGDMTISSVMTLDSLKELGIKKGDKVRAVVKAVNVLLVRD